METARQLEADRAAIGIENSLKSQSHYAGNFRDPAADLWKRGGEYMLSAAQRQAKLAKKARARKQRAVDARDWQAPMMERQCGVDPDYYLLIIDKLEELYGRGDDEGEYSEAQMDHVDALVAGYTPEEYAAALALAKALNWGDTDPRSDDGTHRAEQRRQQGRDRAPA
jgi:hypothetical protein